MTITSDHRAAAANGGEACPSDMVGRVLAILDAFAEGDLSLTLSELSERSKLPKPTAHRIAMSLVSRRLLDRDGARFRLGVHLFELGGRVPLHRQLREAAAPYLEMLYERTRQVIHFAIPEQGDALYLDKVARQNTLHLVTHQGARLPLHCTAIGKALLAYLPPESLYEAFNRKLDRRTPRTLVTRQLILEQLAEIRRTGVAFEIEESARNIACAASPVLGRDGFAIAAVSVTSSALAFDLSRFGPAVKATAAELRRVLDSSPSQSPARDAPSSVSVVANALR